MSAALPCQRTANVNFTEREKLFLEKHNSSLVKTHSLWMKQLFPKMQTHPLISVSIMLNSQVKNSTLLHISFYVQVVIPCSWTISKHFFTQEAQAPCITYYPSIYNEKSTTNTHLRFYNQYKTSRHYKDLLILEKDFYS